jgi:hypothetical protein
MPGVDSGGGDAVGEGQGVDGAQVEAVHQNRVQERSHVAPCVCQLRGTLHAKVVVLYGNRCHSDSSKLKL